MKDIIQSLLLQALHDLSKTEGFDLPKEILVLVERPRDPTHGDLSSNIAMVLAKSLKMPPRVLAEKLMANLPKHPDIAKVTIAGAGFINFSFETQYLVNTLEDMWHSSHLGVDVMRDEPIVVVDYSSPNLAKEMHVGHLRSTIIGDAIARVLEFKGWHVIRQNHVGDWGTQFGMLIAHFADELATHSGQLKLNDLESFYKAAKTRFDEDAAFATRARQWVVRLQSGDADCFRMWESFIKLSLAHCHEVYTRLGVALKPSDVRAESAYNDDLPKIIQKLKEKGLLTENEGAQCVFLDGFKGKNDEPLPLIVQKKDGGFLYASTDLAAICYRQSVLKAKRVLYVVDARQALHFQQVFAVAKRAGFASNELELEHISFGMVLDKAGRPYKSRDGGVTKLADLLDEAENRASQLIESKKTTFNTDEERKHLVETIAISSVKYADLSKNRTSDYIFDWDCMISFEGNTAPYLLYAYTRVMSIFQKAQIKPGDIDAVFVLENAHDEELAKQIALFPEVIDAVALKATPHLLCTYLYDLASVFSSFYESCPILSHPDAGIQASRLKLAALTASVLKCGLNLLGIETLSRM